MINDFWHAVCSFVLVVVMLVLNAGPKDLIVHCTQSMCKCAESATDRSHIKTKRLKTYADISYAKFHKAN